MPANVTVVLSKSLDKSKVSEAGTAMLSSTMLVHAAVADGTSAKAVTVHAADASVGAALVIRAAIRKLKTTSNMTSNILLSKEGKCLHLQENVTSCASISHRIEEIKKIPSTELGEICSLLKLIFSILFKSARAL